jgi:hypothetical protein
MKMALAAVCVASAGLVLTGCGGPSAARAAGVSSVSKPPKDTPASHMPASVKEAAQAGGARFPTGQ